MEARPTNGTGRSFRGSNAWLPRGDGAGTTPNVSDDEEDVDIMLKAPPDHR